ncbi:MAG: 4-phosphoerythronate dehydrogenase [Chlorobiota bacterium]|nr:4-phosphoerythronate dehydrogenase [Chlorobiota bacterium]QQS66674.1 MAG: 4-phosphoerythronate dehydrogenase [Chlorobiota bacterium]
MNPLILCDESILFAQEAFSQFGELKLIPTLDIKNNLLEDANLLIIRSVTKIDETLLKNSNIKIICTATTGTDNIDLEYLAKNNIKLFTSEGANSIAVAEYIQSCLIFILNKYYLKHDNLKLGIIGMGRIGNIVSKVAINLGFNIVVYDPPKQLASNNFKSSSLTEIFDCDIITLHVPLTRRQEYETYHLVDNDFLSSMKKNATLINTSRGGVVDSMALIKALNNKTITSAILDVWEEEPFFNLNLFNLCDIITPHIAGYSLDAKLKATEMLSISISKELKKTNIFTIKNILPATNNYLLYDVLKDNNSFMSLIKLSNKNIELKNEPYIFNLFRKNLNLRRDNLNV